MDSEQAQIRRVEAQALLDLNQQRRARGEATLIVLVGVAAAGLAAALGAKDENVVIPLPGFSFLLLSLSFQQFADVSVLGAARLMLERLVNEEVGAPALIYETYVAGIRQRPPLVRSVRILQSLVIVGTVAGTAGASVIAFRREALVWIPFAALTGLAALSAALSYRDMIRSHAVASADLARAFAPPSEP